MADIRDIMRDRLTNFEKFLGGLTAAGQFTEAERVRSFQNGTFTIEVTDLTTTDLVLSIEGTDNKGQNKWFSVLPTDDDSDNTIEITKNGTFSIAYNAEITWIRLRWVSGGVGATVKVNMKVSKNIIGRK